MSVEKIGQKVVDPYYINTPFTLGAGVDKYNPPISSATLSFLTLTNVEGRLGRLKVSTGLTSLQAGFLVGGDVIVGFQFYSLPNRQYYNLYAFSKTSIYIYNFVTGLFTTTPIYTGFPSTTDPYVFLQWFGALYVTKLGAKYVKLTGSLAAETSDSVTGLAIPYARYGIIANAHVYLGGFYDGSTVQLGGIRWGDLDSPESFGFNSSSSEADFYLLDPDAQEITGVSFQRGQPIVYAKNAIWIGTYVGFPGGFTHQPLFPGLGNIFHNAVIRLKEIDYFIGPDSFYTLNGLQVSPLGQEIFEFFINDVVTGPNTSVRGFSDTRRYQLFWVYQSVSMGTLWSIVYNYKDQTWCDRDPQSLSAWFDAPRNSLQGYQVIANVATIINSDSTIINNDNVYPLSLNQFAGSTVVSTADNAVLKVDGTQFVPIVETFDFYFGNFNLVKEILTVILDYVGVGTPNITCSIASRENQSEPIVYATAIPMSNIDGSFAFYSRTPGVGKYLRFKFTWNNTSTDYITDLTLLAFSKIDHSPDENPPK